MTVREVQAAAGARRRAQVRAEQAEAALRDAIRSALAQGASPGAIAEAAGLSRQRVYQIRDGKR